MSAAGVTRDSPADNGWTAAAENPVATPAEVHVWVIDSSDFASFRGDLLEVLQTEERQRAARFRFPSDRDRFVRSRAMLRVLLGRYLHRRPSEIRLGYSIHGKPFLDGASTAGSLEFNLSHSGGVVLLAVTARRRVGVDVERVSSDRASEKIAARFFSPEEQAVLSRVEPDRRSAAFFACWTRKEAYVKARGEGLSLPLGSFSVSLAPGEPAALVSSSLGEYELSRWQIRDVGLGPGYRGAVAVEGAGWRLRQWRFPLSFLAAR